MRISDRLQYYGKIAAIIAFIIGGLVVLSWFTSIWYLCNSGKKAPQLPPPQAHPRRQMYQVPATSNASITH